ncbi:MAG: hypothetical protein KDI46_08605 [Alphaproteobacteria bacterium]|nr:hypothetical protein [Alphaproteobacteria bacterium]
MLKRLLLITACSVLPFAAHAQERDYDTQIHSKTLYVQPKDHDSGENADQVEAQKRSATQIWRDGQPHDIEDADGEEEQKRIWNKYKSLAEERKAEEEAKAAQDAENEDEDGSSDKRSVKKAKSAPPPAVEKAEDEPADDEDGAELSEEDKEKALEELQAEQQNTLLQLLQEYKHNKESQKKIQTRSMPTPKIKNPNYQAND